MTRPKPIAASVIIPVYNGANYITQQLDALAAQTGNPSFEVLICDNGSTDGTRAVVEGYNAPYPLRVIDASQRGGASHARNMGAVQAAGDILIFCDGDDLVEPDWVVSHLHVQNLYSPVIASGSLLHDRVNTPEVLRAYGLEPGDDQKTLSTRTRILYDEELT
ncbi:MAG: glycosyltransferase family 2 protein, partial [Rothia dentocariosa]